MPDGYRRTAAHGMEFSWTLQWGDPRHRMIHGEERAVAQGPSALDGTPVRDGERGEHVVEDRRVAVTHALIACIRNTGVGLSGFRRSS